MEEFDLLQEKISLRGYKWIVKDSDYIVIIIHGLAEHAKRYGRFARALNDANISAISMDLRGHGESIDDGLGYFVKKDGVKTVLNDISSLYHYTSKTYKDKKIILFGHSMGSIFARCIMQTTNDKYEKYILSGVTINKPVLRDIAPYLSGFMTIFGEKKGSKFLDSLSFGSYNKAIESPRTSFDWLSRDEAEVDKYIEDKKCGFAATARMFKEVSKAILFSLKDENINNMDKDIPIFIISGALDPAGSNGYDAKYIYDSYKNAGLNVEYKIYDDARHELLNETNRDEVTKDIIDFINA